MPSPAGPCGPSTDPLRAVVDPFRTDVAIAIIVRDGGVLICRRRPAGSFAGYWEFPGGKREAGETVTQCLVREVREELAMDVEPVHGLPTIDHDYPRGRIRLHPYVCAHRGGEPQLLASQAAKWVVPHDLRRHTFPPANDGLIECVIAHLTNAIARRPGG